MKTLNYPKFYIEVVILFVCVVVTDISHGWGVGTHARLTKQSYLRSELGATDELIKELGLRQRSNLFELYFDVSLGQVESRLVSERMDSGIVLDARSGQVSNMPASNEAGTVEFPNEGVYQRSPVGWLMRGAIREDDIGIASLQMFNDRLRVYRGENPLDDPYAPPQIWRVMRHFYDPLNDSGFVSNCIAQFAQFTGDTYDGSNGFAKTPDWALGVEDAFADQLVEMEERRNHFTVLDAREAMYRALTGMGRDGETDIASPTMTDSEVRKAYWATTFRALGDVAHLIQDMAQPQHTRNDPHSGVLCFGEVSGLESYTEARAKGEGDMKLEGIGTVVDLAPIDYGTYPIPSFSRYSDYFSTASRSNGSALTGVTKGLGIADYSHRGFFTTGKNIGNEDYPLPVPDVDNYVTDSVSITIDENVNLSYDVLIGDVPDRLLGIANPAALTSENVFSDYVFNAGFIDVGFTLTPANYRDNADLLLPRAVAYGAGLINYFFRGRLELSLPKAGAYGIVDHAEDHGLASDGIPRDESEEVFGFKELLVNVRNTTEAIREPGDPPTDPVQQDLLDGEIRAVVKYQLNHCYEPDLSGEMRLSRVVMPIPDFTTFSGCNGVEYLTGDPGYDPMKLTEALVQQKLEKIAVSDPVSVGEAGDVQIGQDEPVEIEFDFSNDPIPVNAREVYLQVVYRGKLGPEDDPSKVEDDAVVVATKDISEPTFLTIINSTDYFRLDGKFYTKEQIDGDPELSDRLDLVIEDEAIPGGRDAILGPRELTEVKFRGNETPWASVDRLPVGRFSRIAILTDAGEMDWNAEYFWSPYDISFPDTPFQTIHDPEATLSQYRPDDYQYDFEFYDSRRGVYTHYEFAVPQWHIVFDHRGEFSVKSSEMDERIKALPEFEELSPWPITCDFLGVVASCSEG